MKKFTKNIIRISTVLLALNLGTANAVQSPEQVTTHGSACQPIFLQQALDLGLKWTRQGVFNDNPLGSGIFFWVACPLVITDDNTGNGGSGSDAYAHIFYEDRDGSPGTRTTCFAMRQDSSTHAGGVTQGQVGARVSNTDSTPGTGRRALRLSMTNLVKNTDKAYDANSESWMVACKLYPQAGIRAIQTEMD